MASNDAPTYSEFLRFDRVATEADAIQWCLNAALQRNPVYASEDEKGREEFRAEWRDLVRRSSQRYHASGPVSDAEHCEIIRVIAATLSNSFAPLLKDGRLRFGTSQKAFNLYLKYLWQLGEIPPPPHCPIDRVILDELGIDEAWTRCDDEAQYKGWINAIRNRIQEEGRPLLVCEWENEVWLRNVAHVPAGRE